MRGKIFTSILISLVSLICYTSPASAQWVQHFTTTMSDIRSTYFLDSQTGWAVGNSGAMTKTTDGGTSWVSISGITSSNIFRVYFSDANTGFACGAGIFRTTDGGMNWTTVAGFSTCLGMDFINANIGWITATAGKIYKTTDAGLNWNLQSSGTTAAINCIDFADENTGYYGTSNGVISKSTNGGNNWTALNAVTGNALNSISFSNASTGMFTGDVNVLFRTTDGGNNWTSLGSLPSGRPYNALYWMPNTPYVWTSSQGVGVYGSTNSGATWTRQNNFSRIYNISGTGLNVYAGDDSGKVVITKTGGFYLDTLNGFSGTAISTSQIHLQWSNDLATADRYIIERSLDSLNWTVHDSIFYSGGGSWFDYEDMGLTTGTKYYYRVLPKKEIFTGNYSNVISVYTYTNSTSLSLPSDNSTVFTMTPLLSWSKAPSAVLYKVDVSANNFGTITYSANVTDTSITIPVGALQNGTIYRWRVKCYNNIGAESPYTTARRFTPREPNYGSNQQSGNNLYYFANSTSGADLAPSKPNYNWRDTAGSIDLIVNQIGSPSYGNLDDGWFTLPNVFNGNKAKFFGNDYTGINIGTNGYLSFVLGDLTAWPIEPMDGGLPQAGTAQIIAPFWADLYYQSPALPSRLCYKVTADEIIITYSKVIMYDVSHTANASMYISFQVIIHHEAAPAMNSRIEVMYNYDETGLLFKTNYNADFLRQHLIGIQGLNISNIYTLTYRVQNSANQYAYKGPIFGSNLGLAFSPDATLLPVELASFTSNVTGSNVKLNWSTVGEQNNSGFDLERKTSGSNEWKKISFVQGNGTTNQSQSYSHEDRNVTSGKYQYRLKQIDFNGNFKYYELSNEVEIGVPKKFNLSQNYPNPFNPNTVISYQLSVDGFVSLKVYDITGKEITSIVNKNQNAGYYTVEFNGANLSSGMYFYTIQTGDFSAVKKMILIK